VTVTVVVTVVTVVVVGVAKLGGWWGGRALATSFRFFVAFFTVTTLGSSSSGETGGAFTSWHAVHVVFRPGSPALSNLRNARTGELGLHGKGARRGTRVGAAPAS